jgi:hypothetical protein
MVRLRCYFLCKPFSSICSRKKRIPPTLCRKNQEVSNCPLRVITYKQQLTLYGYRSDCLSSSLKLSLPLFNPDSTQNNTCLLTNDEFETETCNIFNDIHNLSSVFDEISTSPSIAQPEILNYNKQRSSIERRLLSLQMPSTPDPVQDYISNACRIATLMCTNYLFRDLSPLLSIMASLQTRLMDTLLVIEPNLEAHHMTSRNTEILLWICFIGGMVGNEKTYFAEGIFRMMRCLDLKCWKEVEMCLERHLWPGKMRDRNFSDLWHEVQSHIRQEYSLAKNNI